MLQGLHFVWAAASVRNTPSDFPLLRRQNLTPHCPPPCVKPLVGLLDLGEGDGSKYLMVQCHRGQFSNRLMCLKVGVHLARALHRVLVLPVFTDVEPAVDVSKYVSMECFR